MCVFASFSSLTRKSSVLRVLKRSCAGQILLAENALKCQKELQFLCENWRTKTHRRTHTHRKKDRERDWEKVNSEKWQLPIQLEMEKRAHNSRKMLSLRVSFTLTHWILGVAFCVCVRWGPSLLLKLLLLLLRSLAFVRCVG